MVFGQMNEPPGARLRVALSALAMTEYFRDERNQDVLLFIDNIFRFSQAGSEVFGIARSNAKRGWLSTTLAAEMGDLQERITSTNKDRSLRSKQSMFQRTISLIQHLPNTFAHLDSTIVLEVPFAELGIYPAVDPLLQHRKRWRRRLSARSI